MRRILPALLLLACNAPFDGDEKDPRVSDPGDTADNGEDTGVIDTAPEDTGPIDTGTEPVDADGDGHYVTGLEGDDCDDGDATVYPGAPELCDGKDNDCSGGADGEGDADGDTTLDCNDYCPVYAQPGASGDGRVSDPMGLLQDAVNEAGASGCNEVRAYYGTYEENVNFNGYGVNMESISGPSSTFIDGGGADSCVIIEENGDGLTDEDNARVYGFTLTNGGGGVGAGARVKECNPTFEGNVFLDNTTSAGGVGGGIRSYNGSPTIVDNEFIGNDANYGGPENGCDGGAIDIRGGAPVITGNLMEGNSAGDGGAIWVAYSDAYIANNLILGNIADDSAYEDGEDRERDGQGGGIDVQIGGETGTIIVNNIISDNIASAIGGGIVVYEPNDTYGSVTVANNVISFNNVIDTEWGAGFTQWNDTTPKVYNNIIYGNIGVGAYGDNDTSTWSFTYNNVNGNFPNYDGALTSGGTGNVSVDPGFVAASNDTDWTNDDFRLSSSSAMKDAGDPAVLDASDGSRSDMGAYGGPAGAW